MEQQTAEEWNQRHDGKACRAFIITYEKMKRYEGSWHLICEPLLSGYFFLKTEESKVLEEAQDSIPIDSGEERFLKELGGRDHLFVRSLPQPWLLTTDVSGTSCPVRTSCLEILF